MSRVAVDVLVVGAGPTGLTLACELARRGVPFRLVEQAPGPRPGSRGKGVQPRTLEVFDDLGIVDRVLAHGRLAMPIRSTAADGTVSVGGGEPEALKDRPDVPYTTSLITPQWRVEEALRQRLDELGGAVELDTTLVSSRQDDGGVTAVVERAGRLETAAARWVVGCDGASSVVRKQSGVAFEGETRDELRMLVADVEVDGLSRDAWSMWRGAGGFVALCPLPSTDLFQLQVSVGPGDSVDLGREHLQALLEHATGRDDLRLGEPRWSSVWRANVRLAERYRSGDVFLAGDAAHVHSPAGGQGMNTGIQDAHNLGWKLAAVASGAPPDLLDSYESERRPVAAAVLALSDARLAETVRERGLVLRRGTDTTQLDVGYRGGPLAVDDRDEGARLRAGDRAPDATGLETVDGERRWFDLTRGGRFVLLRFGAAVAGEVLGGLRTLDVVEHARGPRDVVDTAGHLRAAYGATEQTLALIRPDGYVATISDAGDAATVSEWLTSRGLPVAYKT